MCFLRWNSSFATSTERIWFIFIWMTKVASFWVVAFSISSILSMRWPFLFIILHDILRCFCPIEMPTQKLTKDHFFPYRRYSKCQQRRTIMFAFQDELCDVRRHWAVAISLCWFQIHFSLFKVFAEHISLFVILSLFRLCTSNSDWLSIDVWRECNWNYLETNSSLTPYLTHTQNGKRNDLNCCVWVRRKMICSNRMEMDGICPMITQLLELSHWRCTFYSQSAFTCFQIDLFSQHICIPWIKQTFVPVKYFRHSIDGFGIRSHFERTLEIVFVLLQLQCVIQFSQKPLRMSF